MVNELMVVLKAGLAVLTGLVFAIVLGDYFSMPPAYQVVVWVIIALGWFGVLVENE